MESRNIDFDKEIECLRLIKDLQEAKVVLHCNRCGSEIYIGQEYFLYDTDNLCESCFDEFQSDEKFNNRRIAGDYCDD